jgi:hypothetical protein
MKKLNSSLYTILIVITFICTTSCGKESGGSGGGGGIAVLLGDLIGFWQSGSDSFTFQEDNGKLGGSGEFGGRNGTVNNSKINNTSFTFDLTFDDDNSVKSYSGTIDATKKVLKLTSSGATFTFNKQ